MLFDITAFCTSLYLSLEQRHRLTPKPAPPSLPLLHKQPLQSHRKSVLWSGMMRILGLLNPTFLNIIIVKPIRFCYLAVVALLFLSLSIFIYVQNTNTLCCRQVASCSGMPTANSELGSNPLPISCELNTLATELNIDRLSSNNIRYSFVFLMFLPVV